MSSTLIKLILRHMRLHACEKKGHSGMQTNSLEARRRQRIVKELENSPEVEGRNGRPRQVLLNDGLRESVVDGSPVAPDA